MPFLIQPTATELHNPLYRVCSHRHKSYALPNTAHIYRTTTNLCPVHHSVSTQPFSFHTSILLHSHSVTTITANSCLQDINWHQTVAICRCVTSSFITFHPRLSRCHLFPLIQIFNHCYVTCKFKFPWLSHLHNDSPISLYCLPLAIFSCSVTMVSIK